MCMGVASMADCPPRHAPLRCQPTGTVSRFLWATVAATSHGSIKSTTKRNVTDEKVEVAPLNIDYSLSSLFSPCSLFVLLLIIASVPYDDVEVVLRGLADFEESSVSFA